MIEEISKNQIEAYARYFTGLQPGMVLASVVAGNTNAQLWYTAQPDHQGICLLWDKGNNVFYLSGQWASPETIQDFAVLIQTHIREKAIQERLSYFKVKPLSPSLEYAVPEIFQNIPLHRRNKLFYTFRATRVRANLNPALEGVQFLPIDAEFLAPGRFENNHHVKTEIEWMWASLEQFLHNGFGIAAVIDGRVIGWCTAEYVSKTQCGIGIEIIEAFQNKGVATAAAARFVEHCLQRQVVAYWECDKENIGSVRVAEKLGFEKTDESVFWSGQFIG